MATRNLSYATATSSTGGITSLASSSNWTAGYEWFVIDNSTELAIDYFVDLEGRSSNHTEVVPRSLIGVVGEKASGDVPFSSGVDGLEVCTAGDVVVVSGGATARGIDIGAETVSGLSRQVSFGGADDEVGSRGRMHRVS